MLSSRGRAAGVPQCAFWGQFPGVSGIADSHWLSHSNFFWNLYFGGSHYCQFLSGLHYPLFPAAQIQKDRWRGGRGLRGLIGQNGDYELPIMHHTVEAKGLEKEVKTLISMTKEPWIRPLCDLGEAARAISHLTIFIRDAWMEHHVCYTWTPMIELSLKTKTFPENAVSHAPYSKVISIIFWH